MTERLSDVIEKAIDAWAEAYRACIRPDGGMQWADGFVAKIRKDELRKAILDELGDVKMLRRLLAVRVAGATLYADDGELQDNNMNPLIDFLRDSAPEIERKLQERATKLFLFTGG